MDNALWILVFAALIVSGTAQVFMAIELRRIRTRLAVYPPGPDIRPRHTSNNFEATEGPLGSPAGYAIYVYRAGRWELEADLSAPGFEPSAPGLHGAYEGQVIKKESAPAPGR